MKQNEFDGLERESIQKSINLGSLMFISGPAIAKVIQSPFFVK